jgi:hypothetical protein
MQITEKSLSRLSSLTECVIQQGILARNVDTMTNLRRLVVYSEESSIEVAQILTENVEKMTQLTSLSLPLRQGLTIDAFLRLPNIRFVILTAFHELEMFVWRRDTIYFHQVTSYPR